MMIKPVQARGASDARSLVEAQDSTLGSFGRLADVYRVGSQGNDKNRENGRTNEEVREINASGDQDD